MPKFKQYIKQKWVKAIVLLVLLLLVWQLAYVPKFVERCYNGGVYKFVSTLQHILFSWLPFSLGDIIYILVTVALLTVVIGAIAYLLKGSFKAFGVQLLRIIIGIEAALLLFYLFWGINYYRPSARVLLQLTDTSGTLKDVKTVTKMIIDSVNNSRSKVSIADLTASDDAIHDTAVKAIKDLAPVSAKYKVYMPAVKSSLLSGLMNYMGTSGYYNPFTGEAQINSRMPVFDKPFTACHEMAHQIGFAHEDEANFVGYVAGVSSKDRLLKYAAYYEATIEFLRYLHRRDTTTHKELKALLSQSVRADLKTDSLYWTRYEGALGDASSKFYDGFLKANKQPAGLRTYNRMIILTMAWYKRQGLY